MLGAMFEEGVCGPNVEGSSEIKKAGTIVSWEIAIKKLLTRVKVKATSDVALLLLDTIKIRIEIPQQDQLVAGRSTLQVSK
jgi:hypothetical protein